MAQPQVSLASRKLWRNPAALIQEIERSGVQLTQDEISWTQNCALEVLQYVVEGGTIPNYSELLNHYSSRRNSQKGRLLRMLHPLFVGMRQDMCRLEVTVDRQDRDEFNIDVRLLAGGPYAPTERYFLERALVAGVHTIAAKRLSMYTSLGNIDADIEMELREQQACVAAGYRHTGFHNLEWNEMILKFRVALDRHHASLRQDELNNAYRPFPHSHYTAHSYEEIFGRYEWQRQWINFYR